MRAARLLRVGKEVSARDLALDEHGLARGLPGDDVGNFAGGTVLLGEDDAASIAVAQPVGGEGDEMGVLGRGEKILGTIWL